MEQLLSITSRKVIESLSLKELKSIYSKLKKAFPAGKKNDVVNDLISCYPSDQSNEITSKKELLRRIKDLRVVPERTEEEEVEEEVEEEEVSSEVLSKRIRELEEELDFMRDEVKKAKSSAERDINQIMVDLTQQGAFSQRDVCDDQLPAALANGQRNRVLELLKSGKSIDLNLFQIDCMAESLANERVSTVFDRNSVRKEEVEEFSSLGAIYKILLKKQLKNKDEDEELQRAIDSVENRAFVLLARQKHQQAAEIISSSTLNPLLREKADLFSWALKAVGKSDKDAKVLKQQLKIPTPEKDVSNIVCLYCKKPGHTKETCRKKMRDDEKANKQRGPHSSLYEILQFFPRYSHGRNCLQEEGYSFDFQQVETMGNDGCQKRDCGSFERWGSNYGQQVFHPLLWKSRYISLVEGRKRISNGRDMYDVIYWCIGILPRNSEGGGQVSIGTEERKEEIQINCGSSSPKQVLFGDPKVQVQNSEQVFGSHSQWWEKVLCYVRFIIRISPSEVLTFGWNGSPFFFTQIVDEGVRLLTIEGYTLSNYLDDFMAVLCISYLDSYNKLVRLSLRLDFYGFVREPSKGCFKPSLVFLLLGALVDLNCMTLSIPEEGVEKIVARCKNLLSKMHREEAFSARDLAKLAGSVMSYVHCFQPALIALNPIYSRIFKMVEDGWDTLHRVKDHQLSNALQWILCNIHHWNGRLFSFPSLIHELFSDASLSGFGATMPLLNFTLHGSWSTYGMDHMHINVLEAKAIFIAMEKIAPLIQGKCLRIFSDSQVIVFSLRKGRSKNSLIQRIVEGIWRIVFQYDIQLVAVEWLPSSQNSIADQLSRLKTTEEMDFGDWEVTPEAFERVQHQLQVKVQFDRFASNYNFKHYPEGARALQALPISNDTRSPSMEDKTLVATTAGRQGSVSTNVWNRFQTLSVREMRTAKEKLLAIRGDPNRLSDDQLTSVGGLIEKAGAGRESTNTTYDSYWNRFVKWCDERNIAIPPTEMDVYNFLVCLFLKCRSGKNCKLAMFAIKKRCNQFKWIDVVGEHISSLVDCMINMAPVSYEIERNEWRIMYIDMWILEGCNFVDRRTYVFYTTLMIIGIRSMLRGSELGSILTSNVVEINKNNINGIRIVVEKVKNDFKRSKKGRVIEIEATNSRRCPVVWLRLWKVCNPQKYLFGDDLPLSTAKISDILRFVATSLKISGSFSSHSLRIGGASEAAFAGFSHTAIQALGDWSSNAIDAYFRAGFASDKNVSRQMGF
ncbi:hypothetical protein C9374_009964 [Naegleria lovaniensis]|uniref:RNase H type-1 domain-containing protein n=1 Tax=Naegleria lovaniensis TaxID=51637 RepID=A0AA88GF06_NAELO|nr:uncharacterized protein C9374_009964 [Naegleria lovaniensis]KAG2375341.1 hypothetical protein C9374_009964 [Naegleria lovaniensis]